MHTLSSASLTCMASASAVECTATVAMPSSLHARRMRSAISPRLAIRILSNISPASLDDQERLAVFHRLRVLDQNALDAAGPWRRDRVHGLHRLHYEERLTLAHFTAFLDEGFRSGLGRHVHRADHGRLHHAGMRRMILARAWRGARAYDRRHLRRCHGRAGGARHAHALGAAPHLDLGELGLLQEARELGHQLGVDGDLATEAEHRFHALAERSTPASASMAST